VHIRSDFILIDNTCSLSSNSFGSQSLPIRDDFLLI